MRPGSRTLEAKNTDRTVKLDALQDRLSKEVQLLVTGEDWRRAVTFAARFRSRSFNNTLLIWVQHSIAHAEGRVPEPMPTHVAGFQQWQQLGRHVMKGQSGYQILAPVTARMSSLEPDNPDSWRRLTNGEKPARGEVTRSRVIGVKPAYVWDVSQTDGKPIPELPSPKLLTGQAPPGLWDGLAQIIAERGFTLHDTPDAASIQGANGVTHWINRTVHVRLDIDDAARCRTLAHEVGHIVLHDDDHHAAAEHRDIAEVEAESLALMIGAAHGMDATQYTIPYVAAWAASRPGRDPVQTVQSTAARVRAATLSILDRLDTLQLPDGTPPGLDRRVAPVVATQVSAATQTDRDRIAMDDPAWCGKEAGHVLLHDPSDVTVPGPWCRDLIEVEAESVAYLVAAHHGLDTAGHTFAYIAGWAGQDDTAVAATATRVLGAARTLIDATDPATSDQVTGAAELAATSRAAVATTAETAARAEAFGDRQTVAPATAGSQLEALRAVTRAAQDWFCAQATTSPAYAAAVTARGHTVDTALRFGVGYAPLSWTGLVDHLRGLGHPPENLLAAGVATTTRGDRLIDRFRGRVTFPVRDSLGVVGFTARDTTGTGGAPKYLNSPAGPLYDKARLLNGMEHLSDQTATVVLVEGPWDALAVTISAGGDMVGLAACGTAVTDHHLELATRGERALVLGPDPDPAGHASLGRTLTLLATHGQPHPSAVTTPPETDLADLHARAGASAVRHALATARPAGLVYAEQHLAAHPPADTPESRVAAARAAAAHATGLTVSQRGDLASVLIRHAGIGLEAARAILTPCPVAPSRSPHPRPTPAATDASARSGPRV